MRQGATSSPTGLGFSAKARRTAEQPISYLVGEAIRNPGLINLAAGLVDPLTLPVEECLDATRRILSDAGRGRVALQYDTTLGLAPLREVLIEHLERLEGKPASAMGLTASDVVVTTGSQQALYLIGDVLLDPGDVVVAGNPSYFVYTGTLGSFGAKVLTVPMDENGLDVDAVERLLTRLELEEQLHRVKLIYCTSYFDNPTGLTLSLDRRKRLYELARRFSRSHRILVLEDAAYRELRYDGDALPSIKSFDPDNRFTILAQTFSKPFAPGIKTGYTTMPRDLRDAVINQKGNHDFGSSNLCQQIALEAMRSGSYHVQVERLRSNYREKRDRLLSALERSMPKHPQLSWTRPGGGLYVWVTLPEAIDTSRESAMFQECLRRGVLYVPGAYCFQPDDAGFIPQNHLRLSFGQVSPDGIEPGVERLAAVVREQLAATESGSRESKASNFKSQISDFKSA